jgi:hypothetical protein
MLLINIVVLVARALIVAPGDTYTTLELEMFQLPVNVPAVPTAPVVSVVDFNVPNDASSVPLVPTARLLEADSAQLPVNVPLVDVAPVVIELAARLPPRALSVVPVPTFRVEPALSDQLPVRLPAVVLLPEVMFGTLAVAN